jgi:hypothetical protein
MCLTGYQLYGPHREIVHICPTGYQRHSPTDTTLMN